MTTTTTKADPEAVARLVKALGHPLRVAVLQQMDPEAARSPSQLAEALDVPLPNLSYHMRMLVQVGALRLATTKPRRGAIEHFYTTTPAAAAALALFDAIEAG